MWHIRRATNEDVAVLVEFSKALAWETEQKELDHSTVLAGVSALLVNPEAIILVAVGDDGTVLGEIMMGGREWSEWSNGENWWVTSIYVRSDQRELGLARALWREMTTLAKQASPRVLRIRAFTHRKNTKGQQAHPRYGLLPNPDYLLYEDNF